MGVGEKIFDHYGKHFKMPVERKIFEGHDGGPSIQILVYDKVVKGCKLYASLGLTHYKGEVGGLSEIVIVVDDGFDFIPALMANSLFYIIENRMKIVDGLSIKGIKNISKEFYSQSLKDCFYFTEPYCFPESFYTVQCQYDEDVDFYLAILLSSDEADYLAEFGSDKFEDLLESANVDVFDIKRKSVV